MPVAQQDQWQQDLSGSPGEGSIGRLEAALARIAVAAGRRQDALRVAELTAQAARHQMDLLAQAQDEQGRSEAAMRDASASAAAEARAEEMHALALRLEGLIETLRTAVGDPAGSVATVTGLQKPAAEEG